MNHAQRERVEDLKSFISTYHQKRQGLHEDRQALDADLLWNASRFWANVLHRSQVVSRHKSRVEFDQFAEQYNSAAQRPVNTSALFNLYWLREVMGRVHVALAASAATRTFAKLRPWRNELQFVSQFYGSRSKSQSLKVPTADVEGAAALYESQTETILNWKGVYLAQWASTEEDEVKFSAMDVYFDHFLEYWDYFEFLFQWEEYIKKKGAECFIIPKADFQEVVALFRHMSSSMPDIATLESQKAIVSQGDHFRLERHNTVPSYWTALQDKIMGHYWEQLASETSSVIDKDRLIIWLEKCEIGDFWPDHLTFVTETSKIRFLDASLELLLEQEDLIGCEQEVDKLRLDSRDGFDAAVFSKAYPAYLKLNSANLFELYGSLRRLEGKAQITHLHEQPARHWLHFLISTIVQHDDEWHHTSKDNNTTSHLPRIFTLLREGVEKPFLVWVSSEAIRFKRPSVLPYLLVNPCTSTFALSILDELEFQSNDGTVQHQYWIKAVDLILHGLPTFDGHQELYAEVIFQLFRQLMAGKYRIPYNRLNRQQELEVARRREMRERTVLDMVENAPLHYGVTNGDTKALLLPELFLPLAAKFVSYEEADLYRNGTVKFPMLKWNALFWLMKSTTHWKVQQHFADYPEKRKNLVDSFLAEYLRDLERTEVEAYDYWQEKEVKKVPLWSEKIERLELLDWVYPIYFLHEYGKLSTFLSPRLDFEPTDDLYNEKNSFTAEKLRTHIGVLLQVLRKLVLPALSSGLDKAKLLQIKERIETEIVEYLKVYSKDLPREGRLDLFSYRKEQLLEQSEKEALLPQVAQAINWFSKKEEVVSALVDTGDIVKLLTTLDYITAEGVKKLMLDRVSTTDVVCFLEQQIWIPEIQAVLTKLSRYPALLPQIEQAVKFWKEKVVQDRNTREYRERLYISELLFAYLKRDQEAIEAVEAPDKYRSSMSELDYRAYKEFYLGLLHIKEEPQKSVRVFNDLAQRYPAYGSIALKRMVAKLNLAALESDLSIYREAYYEWQEAAGRHLTATWLDAMEPELSASLLIALLALGEHREIEERFYKLELPTRMTEPILRIRVNSLMEQKRTGEALLLVEAASTYHQFSGYSSIGFIKELEDRVSGEDNIAELSAYSHLIFSTPPAKLIRLLPPSFNGKENIHEFLIKEIVSAAEKMLGKIRTLDEIKSEDKFNDLMELVLDSRLNGIGMHVGEQSRGGLSDSADSTKTKQPGERDLPIMDRNKKVWLVCEALIYRGKTTAVQHLKKVFDYHHQRQAFAMLFYDNGSMNGGFESNWKRYSEGILPKTDFPIGMEITSPFEDISSVYDCEHSAVKVGKTAHGTDTSIYHIFVNIDYKLNT